MTAANAACEIAKPSHAKGQPNDEAAAQFGVWLDRIVGYASGASSTDYWGEPRLAKRIEAAIFDREWLSLLAMRAKTRLEALGVRHRRLAPPKIGLALLAAATVEYDDDLHRLWANLLASALDPAQDPVDRGFVSLLADLSAEDARALERLHAAWLDADLRPLRTSPLDDGVQAPTGNLSRLGLIEPEPRTPSGNRAPPAMTELGAAFCRALGLPGLARA
jgi:hypothetical protein